MIMGKERKVVNLNSVINQKDTPPVHINTETSQAKRKPATPSWRRVRQ